MTKKVLRIERFVSGIPCPIAGWYVVTFDHDAYDGLGDGIFTSDKSEAMVFDSVGEALLFWKKRSKIKPLRADGKANRPMTSATVSVVNAEGGG